MRTKQQSAGDLRDMSLRHFALRWGNFNKVLKMEQDAINRARSK